MLDSVGTQSEALIEHKSWGYSSAGRASEWHVCAAERSGHPLLDHARDEPNRPSYRLSWRDDNDDPSSLADSLD